jgi:hypothetical protein
MAKVLAMNYERSEDQHDGIREGEDRGHPKGEEIRSEATEGVMEGWVVRLLRELRRFDHLDPVNQVRR